MVNIKEFITAEEIKTAYFSGTKNTYWGKIVHQTDYTLFIKIENSEITGICEIKNFALNRFPSFSEVIIPERLQVTIIGIDDKQRFLFSTIPSFTGFKDSIKLLGIEEKGLAEGKVFSGMQNGANFSATVTLAPNLTTLISGPVNAKVEIFVKSINFESKKIKSKLQTVLENGCNEPFDCRPFTVTDDLPAWVDLNEWKTANAYQKTESPTIEEKKPLVEPTWGFQNDSGVSPFSLSFRNEIVKFPEKTSITPYRVYYEAIRKSILSEEHRQLASAFAELKFSTHHQLERYMFLRFGKLYPNSFVRIKKMAQTLVKAGVLINFKFHSDGSIDQEECIEKSSPLFVYSTGDFYRNFTGLRPVSPHLIATCDPSVSKTQLAANQLAIAVLHKYRDTYISLTPRTVLQFGNENFIAPKFQIATPDGIFYIEALRRNGHTEFLKKLERYDQYFKECPDKLGTVCITLENNAEVEILKNEIAPLKLSFKVGLTTDLECIPFEPEMIYPTQKQNFFTHLFKRA